MKGYISAQVTTNETHEIDQKLMMMMMMMIVIIIRNNNNNTFL